jgi:hypothetical protein
MSRVLPIREDLFASAGAACGAGAGSGFLFWLKTAMATP